MTLNVFTISREGTHVLGPGNRYVIWTQGCHKRCLGCVTPESHTLEGGTPIKSTDLAADIILNKNIDGITITGGEPFIQSEALTEMLSVVRQYRPELSVIIYTGYEYETLLSQPLNKKLLDYADILIDGAYIDELNDNKGIRGSSNQRIIALSERLKPYVVHMTTSPRKIQPVANKNGTVWRIGVPNKESN